jgi:hypothetical protein
MPQGRARVADRSAIGPVRGANCDIVAFKNGNNTHCWRTEMKSLCIPIAICLAGSLLVAQEPPKPSKEHELIARSAGKHSGQMKIWVQGLDAEPASVPFEETNTVVLGGFWLRTEFSSGPYQGSGMSGYDPVKKKYVGTWADNMSPHMNVSEGTFDEQQRQLTMIFKGYDPATQKMTEHKSVTTYASPGQPATMTMYMGDPESGKFVKSFVLVYDTKAKDK